MYYTLIDSCVGGAGAGIGPEVDRKWTKLMRGIYKPRVLAPCDFQKKSSWRAYIFLKIGIPWACVGLPSTYAPPTPLSIKLVIVVLSICKLMFIILSI